MSTALIATPTIVLTPTSIDPTTEASSAAAAQSPSAPSSERPFSVAYAAGFTDGEAFLGLVRQRYRCGRKDTISLVCSITQNNREVLEHLRDGSGIDGRIYSVKRRSFHRKPVWVLNFVGKKAMAFIALLTPHLIRKRAEALTAAAYWVEGQVGTHFGRHGVPPEIRAIRERLYLQMRSFK